MPVAVEIVSAPLCATVENELHIIYADSPDFVSSDAAIAVLKNALGAGDTLYAAVFNARHIASVLVRGEGETRTMRYLCVHHATRGRGVAERLISELRAHEKNRGTQWLEADFNVQQEGVPELLLALGFIPHGAGHYRYHL